MICVRELCSYLVIGRGGDEVLNEKIMNFHLSNVPSSVCPFVSHRAYTQSDSPGAAATRSAYISALLSEG